MKAYQTFLWRKHLGVDNKLNGKKTYEYVFEYFSEQILSGVLRLNDKIPTERDIAEQLGVSRNSVREVMHMMEITGLIECRQGSGNYVRCNPEEYMLQSVNMVLRLLDIDYQEMLDLRISYENTALKLAIDNATNPEIREIFDLLRAMDECTNAQESAEMDIKFHHLIVNASHNRLLILYYSMMDRLLNMFIKNMRSRILEEDNKADELRSAHWDIYQALVTRDVPAGFAAMDTHFTVVSEQLNKIAEKM